MPNDNQFDYNFGNKPGISSDRGDGGHGGGTHVDLDGEFNSATHDDRAWNNWPVGIFIR